jgi:hypothetical protein
MLNSLTTAIRPDAELREKRRCHQCRFHHHAYNR